MTQEELIKASGVPYTIVQATQFFEFLGAIADEGGAAGTVHLPTAPMQPLAADDVAAVMAAVGVSLSVNGVIELVGPESLSIAAFVDKFLSASGDKRSVVADPQARHYGAALDGRGLNPGANPRLGPTRFEEWAARAGLNG